MKEKQAEQTQPRDADKTAVTGRPAGNATADPALTESGPFPPALPPATDEPAGGPGRVDVTGIMPEGIRIDPNITEGHPGYEESGDSEIIPLERLGGGEGAGGEDKVG
jgi:hypothetical protein